MPLRFARQAVHSHWQQQGSEPLFPDMLWSQPENKFHAGKLLIVGGTEQGFAGAAEAYAAAEKAGVGTARVMLPGSLQRTVAKLFPTAEFAPSTPSGSFGMSALAELLDASSWADGVLIAGDTGHNSETTQLFETFLSYHPSMSSRAQPRDLIVNQEDLSAAPDDSGRNDRKEGTFQLTLCGDIIDSFAADPGVILGRPETVLILTLEQLQKIAVAARHHEAFKSDMGLLLLTERLLGFNKLHAAHLLVLHNEIAAVAVDGRISTTQVANRSTTQLAASAATWWLQNPEKPFEALTTALFKHQTIIS